MGQGEIECGPAQEPESARWPEVEPGLEAESRGLGLELEWPEVEPGLEAESQGLGLELEWPQQELECESKLRAVG